MSDRRNKRSLETKTISPKGLSKHTDSSTTDGDEPAGPSGVSIKSDRSMGLPLNFAEERSKCQIISEELTSCSVCKKVLRDLVYLICGHRSCKPCLGLSWDQPDLSTSSTCANCEEKFVKDTGTSTCVEAKKSLKKAMKNKFTLTSEGNGDYHSPLKSIYTTLLITTAEDDGPNEEHEYRHIKSDQKDQQLCDHSVDLSEILKFEPDQEKPNRTVLTKGVAGIGKSFAVQKFIFDLAEDEANQEVDFVFSLAFRELNFITTKKSLHELLIEFHPALRHLKDYKDYTKTKIIVILDGLDEIRDKLDFNNSSRVTSLDTVTSVGELIVNLIQGNLLPDANIWIMSRPAAATQIPAEYINMVTEIRGFTDAQKVEYFKRRFSDDLSLATKITSCIQSSKNLDIMCQIPVFCWISSVLFQEVFGRNEETEMPQTLTELMAYFLFAQTKRRSRKYDRNPEKNRETLLNTHREFLLKLGKMAFVKLLDSKQIFYEEDLEDCGIDIAEASIYSGLFNAALREEEVFFPKKIFFFVNLTLQEFFAALHVYECLKTKKTKELKDFLPVKDKDIALLDVLKMTVDKVLEKKNGHLDFFLRFLLGLMVEPNQKFLQGLLTPLDQRDDTDKKILTYLRSIRRKTLSPDSCINIFQMMIEMRDHKVKDEIEEYLKLSDHSKIQLAPLHCSALAYMLQVSKKDLDLLDFKSYNTSDDGRRRLIPAVRNSKKAVLSGCLVTEKDCDHLVKAFESNASHLVELDLSYNYPGDSGSKKLSKLRDDPQYQLKKLNLDYGGTHRLKAGFRKYACELTFTPDAAHQNLVLSEGNRKVTWKEDDPPHLYPTGSSDLHQQVLCDQDLTGRHYWEVEVSGSLSIGVTQREAVKKEKEGPFKMGHSKDSWCLVCSSDGFHVLHHNKRVDVFSLGWRTSRLGVYLDWPAGTLSFYRVPSDSLIHLHTYTMALTQPLYPAVELKAQSSAVFYDLK